MVVRKCYLFSFVRLVGPILPTALRSSFITERFFHLIIMTVGIIIIIIALDNATYKMLHKLKSACFIRKTNSEQVRLQVLRKSCWTNRQVPQFDRQLIPTAGTSNSKGSQTPIRTVARHNKIPTNGGSQSRPTRNC